MSGHLPAAVVFSCSNKFHKHQNIKGIFLKKNYCDNSNPAKHYLLNSEPWLEHIGARSHIKNSFV